jgi:hypothetical protein
MLRIEKNFNIFFYINRVCWSAEEGFVKHIRIELYIYISSLLLQVNFVQHTSCSSEITIFYRNHKQVIYMIRDIHLIIYVLGFTYAHNFWYNWNGEDFYFILFYWKESKLDSYIFILIFLYHKGNTILDLNLRITNDFNLSWVLAFVT